LNIELHVESDHFPMARHDSAAVSQSVQVNCAAIHGGPSGLAGRGKPGGMNQNQLINS